MRRATAVLTVALAGVWFLGASAQAQRPTAAPATVDALTVRLATSVPLRGYQEASLSDDTSVYVAPRPVLRGGDVLAAQSDGGDLSLSLTADAARRLSATMQKDRVSMLAIYAGSTALGAGTAQVDAAQGNVAISGMTAAQVERITRVLDNGTATPVSAAMKVVPSQSLIQAGETVTVDVFAVGATQLRSYQVSLAITGGDSGVLAIDDIWITQERPDYVFTGKQKFDAIDEEGGRIGSVMMSGGVTPTQAAYLGTYVLRASDDASGTFQVSVKDITGRESILWSAANTDIRFATPVVEVSVGHESAITPTRTRK